MLACACLVPDGWVNVPLPEETYDLSNPGSRHRAPRPNVIPSEPKPGTRGAGARGIYCEVIVARLATSTSH
jgi:hypothetical protein